MFETKYIIIGVAVVVLLFIIFYIKESINEKKGQNGPDKQAIKDIVAKLVPDADSFTVAYAIWWDKKYSGGGRTITTTTHYWHYAIAFKPGMIYTIPLFYGNGDVSYGEPKCLTKENLGMVNAKAGENWISFYDLDREEILSLSVTWYNTKEDEIHPVNIQQKPEYEAFISFIKEFMAEVNGYRQVTVSGKYGKPLKK